MEFTGYTVWFRLRGTDEEEAQSVSEGVEKGWSLRQAGASRTGSTSYTLTGLRPDTVYVVLVSAGFRDTGRRGQDNDFGLYKPSANVTARTGAGDGTALGTGEMPLTASFDGMPRTHDGATAFEFRIAFSEAVAIEADAMRDHALAVAGGSVTAAAPVDGRGDLWSITVTPSGTETISILLAPGRACTESGAICTEDGRQLFAGAYDELPSVVALPPVVILDADAGPPVANASSTGLPAITGTAQVGETLTASVTDIADPDGLTRVTFAYQWVSNDGSSDTDIQGETKSTYTLVASDEGKTIKVRVSFTDDSGTTETLTSTATAEVVVPLKAAFEGVPTDHDGSSIFTFRVRFNPEPRVSYKVLRDESFTVSGGTVRRARRVNGRNDLREIHVEPSGYGDVTITLAGGRACGTHGAICTADGRVLSNTLTATVQGPPSLSVADTRAEEDTDETIDFVVTLSRAASGTVTVDYATSDGSATAGDDYTATSDTLTFSPGETSKTVAVRILDDAVDEGEETLTLTLSNPSGAWIEDGEATGTIENSDPLPVAWTARFGRSVATHLLDALEARLETASGSYVRLGGHQLGGAPDVKEAVERLAPDNNLSLWEEAELTDAVGRHVTVKELLLGSAFHLVSNDGEDGIGPRLSAWGRVATSGFDGQEDRLSLNGTVTTATLGVDGHWKHWLTGVALAYSEGDGSFTQVEAEGGDLASSLTSVHPYVAYALSDRVRLWGMVGYGSGSLQLKLAEQHAMDTDLAMTMGALGIRGSLLEPSQPAGGLALALRSDVLWVRMDTAAVEGMVATEADVSRLRLVLEGSRPVVLAAGGVIDSDPGGGSAARRRRRRDGQRRGGGRSAALHVGLGPEHRGVGARPAGARGQRLPGMGRQRRPALRSRTGRPRADGVHRADLGLGGERRVTPLGPAGRRRPGGRQRPGSGDRRSPGCGVGLRPGGPAGPGPADAVRPGGAGRGRQPGLAPGGAPGAGLVAEPEPGGQPPGQREGEAAAHEVALLATLGW